MREPEPSGIEYQRWEEQLRDASARLNGRRHAIHVHGWEPEPPADEEAVEWFLHTSEPIDSPEQQLAVVDHYRARWMIEEYFQAIKTGCRFQERQLEDYEGLVNLLATFAPVAYHLLLLRSEARRVPESDARSVLSDDQLDVLRVLGRIKLSAQPTAREAYLAVAALGGHIKYNGDPGWRTLAYGFEELQTLTAGWTAAKLQFGRDQRVFRADNPSRATSAATRAGRREPRVVTRDA